MADGVADPVANDAPNNAWGKKSCPEKRTTLHLGPCCFLTPVARLPHSVAMEAASAIEEMSFEDALKELERIVARLESGDEPLDNSIALYERGSQLRQRCADRLDAAQARIEAIKLDSDGRPVGTTSFAAG